MCAIKYITAIFAFVISSLFLLATKKLSAQSTDSIKNELTIAAQIRPRFEMRDGAFKPLNKNEKPATLISQRSRITIDYVYKNVLSIRISPQSVSIWGHANTVQGVENSGNRIGIFETWAKLQISKNWNLKMGRQVISLDDERFFGELDWAQGGRAHDALAIQYEKNKFNVKGFLAYNQNYKSLYNNNINNPAGNLYSTNDAFSYKLMQTIWTGFTVGKKSTLSFLVTNLGLQHADSITANPTTFYSQTFGANYMGKGKKITGNVSAYFQSGKNNLGNTTEAYLLAASVNYPFTKKWNAGLGSDWVSGNKVGIPQTNNRSFNPYFHTGHKFYGAMDYFYVGSSHKNAGLSDNYISLQYKPEKNNIIQVAIHQFFSTAKVVSGTKSISKNLGQEMDFSYSHKLNSFSNIVGGYSFFLPTSTLKYLKNSSVDNRFPQWAWLSINITPTILKNYYSQNKFEK